MGFTLPSAGVTPAPSIRKVRCETKFTLSEVVGSLLGSYWGRRGSLIWFPFHQGKGLGVRLLDSTAVRADFFSACAYLPMQKSRKIASRTSSPLTSPVIEPSAAAAAIISTATISGGIIESDELRAFLSASRAIASASRWRSREIAI